MSILSLRRWFSGPSVRRVGCVSLIVIATIVVPADAAAHAGSKARDTAAVSSAGVQQAELARALPAHAAVAPRMQCSAMTSANLTGVKGAPATITAAQTIAAAANPLGDWATCQITGIIAPQTQFTMDLPLATYTGRYLQLGCGGNCGSDVLTPPAAAYNCVPATEGQFAEATDNEGHVSTVFGSEFAVDQDLRAEFGYQSEHQMALVGKAIIARFYGRRPDRSYFDGCSEGGHEGLSEAQRYPDDFNGIIAGAPAFVFNELEIFFQGWNTKANTGRDRRPIITAADLAPLHAAVVKKCANMDGNTGGLIADPMNCKFNPASIACRRGDVSTAATFCLTKAQVQTVRELYSGPRDKQGKLLYPGWQLPGSELNWVPWLVPAGGGGMKTTIDYGIVNPWLQYAAYPTVQPNRNDENLQFTAANFEKLTQYNDSIYDAYDPNLKAFKAHGGKLILWQGLADPAISPVGTIDYYDTMTKFMGGRAKTNTFARLFMLPGVGHCGGGQGPDSFDGLGGLVSWVETHHAPSSFLTSQISNGQVAATRPVYEYPDIAVDTTGGPPTEAGSYTKRAPREGFDVAKRVRWVGSFKTNYERVCGWRAGKFVCTMGKSGLNPN